MRRLLLLVVLASGCGARDESGPRAAADREPTDEQPTGTAGAGGMWLDYAENAAAAETKYTGKVLTVKGQVHSVTEDEGGYSLNFLVYLDESNRKPPGTIAHFDRSQRDELAKLRPGRDAEVVGRCVGRVNTPAGRNGYAVVLENCRLTPPAPAGTAR